MEEVEGSLEQIGHEIWGNGKKSQQQLNIQGGSKENPD